MCCHNNSGWFTLLIALIIVFFILNREDRDYGYEDREGCERDRDRSGDYNRSGCGCLSGGYNR